MFANTTDQIQILKSCIVFVGETSLLQKFFQTSHTFFEFLPKTRSYVDKNISDDKTFINFIFTTTTTFHRRKNKNPSAVMRFLRRNNVESFTKNIDMRRKQIFRENSAEYFLRTNYFYQHDTECAGQFCSERKLIRRGSSIILTAK